MQQGERRTRNITAQHARIRKLGLQLRKQLKEAWEGFCQEAKKKTEKKWTNIDVVPFFFVDKQSAVVVGDDSINIDYSQFFLLCSRKKKTIMGRKEQRDMCVLLVEGVCLFDCAFSCLHRGKTPKMGRLNKNSLPSGGINSDLKPPVAFTLSLLLLLLLPCFLFRKRVATAQRFPPFNV